MFVERGFKWCSKLTVCKFMLFSSFKGAMKSYFMHYSCVVIIVFNTGLCRPAFSTISFGKLVFHLSVLSVFFCSESNVASQDFSVCVVITWKVGSYSVISFSYYKNSPCKYQTIYKISVLPKKTWRSWVFKKKTFIKKSLEQWQNKRL